MKITLVAAVSQNNIIGKDGNLPWHIKEDMERFKELTLNHTVIMGRKTYESLPNKFRPLPERKNIVISRNGLYNPGSHSNLHIAHSIDEVIRNISSLEETYIIGGQSIYEAFMPLANRAEITRIYKNFEGDAFFPEMNYLEWILNSEEKNLDSEPPFSFMSYCRL